MLCLSFVILSLILYISSFLEESIRWLFANSKIKKAKRVMRTAAKQNKVDFERIWSIALKEKSLHEVSGHVNESFCDSRGSDPKVQTDDTTVKHTGASVEKEVTEPEPSLTSNEKEESKFVLMMVIFKSTYLRKVTLAICFCWFFEMTAFSSIYFMSESLGGNVYFNFLMMSVAELVASLLYVLIVKRFGHKISMFSAKAFTTVLLLSAGFLKLFAEDTQRNDNIFVALYIASMFGLGGSISGNYIYTPELYPTQLRGIGFGMSVILSRTGSTIAPYFKLLAVHVPWASGIILGTGCAIAALLVLFVLPETKNHILPQTVEDLNKMRAEEKEKKMKIKTIS
ncbi:organic anion transporter 3 [Octopus bimaculoides]|nr:organic anion transporter 3 [Octopus bimaculoides]